VLHTAFAGREGRLGKTDEGCRVERALEEGDIAQQPQEPAGFRISLEAAAAPGQQDERKVRPFGLVVDPAGKGVKIESA